MDLATEAFIFLKPWLKFLVFLFASWPYRSSRSSAAWKAAARVRSPPVSWRRCFPRPSCISTMSGKLKKKSLQPTRMSLSGEFSGSDSVTCQLILHQGSCLGPWIRWWDFCNKAIPSWFSGISCWAVKELMMEKSAVHIFAYIPWHLNHLAYRYKRCTLGWRSSQKGVFIECLHWNGTQMAPAFPGRSQHKGEPQSHFNEKTGVRGDVAIQLRTPSQVNVWWSHTPLSCLE